MCSSLSCLSVNHILGPISGTLSIGKGEIEAAVRYIISRNGSLSLNGIEFSSPSFSSSSNSDSDAHLAGASSNKNMNRTHKYELTNLMAEVAGSNGDDGVSVSPPTNLCRL